MKKLLKLSFALSFLFVIAACEKEPIVPVVSNDVPCPNDFTIADKDYLLAQGDKVLTALAEQGGIGSCKVTKDTANRYEKDPSWTRKLHKSCRENSDYKNPIAYVTNDSDGSKIAAHIRAAIMAGTCLK